MPDDLQSTLDAIDQLAVDECSWCRSTIPDNAPSPDFCNADCQANWLRQNQETIELVGYREPTDVAAHAANQIEYNSPETTPAVSEDHCGCAFCTMRESLHAFRRRMVISAHSQVFLAGDFAEPNSRITDDGVRWTPQSESEPFGQRIAVVTGIPTSFAAESLQQFREAMRSAVEQVADRSGVPIEVLWPDRPETIDAEAETPRERALRLRRDRNTGPQQPQRAPRTLNPRRSR